MSACREALERWTVKYNPFYWILWLACFILVLPGKWTHDLVAQVCV